MKVPCANRALSIGNLLPKSTILDDLERHLCTQYTNYASFGSHIENLKKKKQTQTISVKNVVHGI